MNLSEFISITRAGKHTAVLTLDRPPANALNFLFLHNLRKEIDKMNASDEIKVVILNSASKQFFVSGADIREMSQYKTAEEGVTFSEKGHALMDRIGLASKPYIAAIEGVCFGGGLELALACHLRIAGNEARLGLPEVNLGLMPGFGGTRRLPKIVGHARALEMMLTGRQLTAEEAVKTGLVNQTVQKGHALEAALNLAEQIEKKSANSVSAILAAVNSIEETPDKEPELFGQLFPTQDAQEGMRAFLEKRLPNFKDK